MKKIKKYATGGQLNLAGLLGAVPELSDSLMNMFESPGFSSQPTMNASTMHNMVTPYANGGVVPAEVEDDEVVQTPNGQTVKMDGATHEQGGIDILAPAGTKIYSDRLKVNGKTMQARKVKREKTMARLERLLTDNPANGPLRTTYKRTKQQMDAEDAEDMQMQVAAAGGGGKKFAYGGVAGGDPVLDFIGNIFNQQLLQQNNIKGFGNKTALPTATVDNTPFTGGGSTANTPAPGAGAGSTSMKPTTGDYIGMGGNLFNAIAPIINTVANAKSKKPNINRYLGFGQNALDTNTQAEDIVARTKATAKTDLATSVQGSYSRNRDSAMGLSTLRALNAVTDIGANKADNDINNSYANQVVGILGQRSQLENQQDYYEMQGETQRDVNDVQDTDNYFSNMAQNLTNFGNNIQGFGKALNVNKSNNVDLKLLSQLSQYGIGVDENGNIINTK